MHASVGSIHGTTTLTTILSNTGTSPQDTLNSTSIAAGIATNPGGAAVGTASGTTSATALADTSSTSPGATQTFTAGTSSGNAVISNTGTSVTNTNDTAQTPTATNNGVTINVYSGLSTWSGTGASGNWGTSPSDSNFGVNWGTNQGSPGVTSGFTGIDTATFGNVSGHTAVQVNLGGANPNLNSITFNTPTPSATSYTIGGGSDTGTITLSGTTPAINVTAGAHTIAAPIILAANTALAVNSGQQLTLSGQISDTGTGYGLSNTGAGTTILQATNSYTGGTTISNGKVYVTGAISGSNSGTGTGSVSVTNAGTLLAGTGGINGAVSLASGTNLYSGGVVSGTPSTGPGTGMTLNSSLGVTSATLTFALNTGIYNNGSSYHSWSTPNENSSFLDVANNSVGEISFTGSDTIALVDLSSGGLAALRAGTPYLLIQAGLDSDYSGLVTSLDGKTDDLVMDGTGWVMGVGTVSAYTAFTFQEYGATGAALTGSNYYAVPELYLNAGDLEVVPEPGTWAMMIGGLALLVFIQRRRNNHGLGK